VLGTDPNLHDASPFETGVLTLNVGGVIEDYLVIQFPRRKNADDVLLKPEFCTDLLTWLDAGPILEFAPTADPAIELVTVRAPVGMAGQIRQFLRLFAQER
jgi:hypothetical protein